MNKVYRLIWSDVQQAWVPVSEITRAHTKRGGRVARLLAAGLLLSSSYLSANPQGGQVVAGQASINDQPGVVTVNQTSDKAVINWQGFSIQVDELTRFNQPSANAVTLNRVTGQDPSAILGQLKANGNIFLVNPNGIVFGATARVDVNGLVATTHDITNAKFMAGDYRFDIPGKPDASVINKGTITIREGGLAAFVAPGVRNDGVIRARLGRVTLAAGKGFTLDLYGDQLIELAVDPVTLQALDEQGKPMESLVSNSGEIQAENVVMTASAARDVVDSVINMDGLVEASGFSQEGGRIVLTAATGNIQVSGTLDAAASDDNVAADGGEILVLGESVDIKDGAKLSADASAAGGDGGFIETSGKEVTIDEGAAVSARAPDGEAGEWLIDPTDINIEADSCSGTNCLSAASISGTLSAGTNVTVETVATGAEDGNINVNAAISHTGGSNTTLTLNAHNDININASITATTASLDLVLNADADGNDVGVVNLGDVTLDGQGGFINTSSETVNFSSGTLVVNSDWQVQDLNWSGGTITGSGLLTTTGTSTISGSGYKYLRDKSWQNTGTVNHQDGFLELNDTQTADGLFARIDNLSGAVFNVNSQANADAIDGRRENTDEQVFSNAGTLNWNAKSPSQDQGRFGDLYIYNSGTVNVNESLRLFEAPGTDSGSYVIAAGKYLEYSSNETVRNIESTASFSGDGTLLLNAGSMNVESGATVADTVTLDLRGATLNTAGELTLNLLNWSSGIVTGLGKLITTGTTTLDGNGYKYLRDIAWENSGTVNHLQGRLELDDNVSGDGRVTRIDNLVGGIFNVTAQPGVDTIDGQHENTAEQAFYNAGTFNWVPVSPPTTNTSIGSIGDIYFYNSGTVNVNENLQLFEAPGTDSGSYVIAAGKYLEYTSGETVRDIESTSSLSGNGAIRLSAGTITLQSGATFASTLTLEVDGGSFIADADVTVASLNWSAGRIGGAGKLITTGTSTLNGYSKYLDDKTWDNSGTINLNSGSLYLNDSAAAGIPILNNQAAGVINQESASGDPIGGNNTAGTQRLFNNAGTLNWKVARSNDSYSDIQNVEFNNSGTVNVDANLRLVNAPGTDTGTYNIAAGQWLEQYSSVRTFASGSALNGDGQFRLYWYPEVTFAAGSSVANNLSLYLYGGTLNSEIALDINDLTMTGGTLNSSHAIATQTLNISGGTLDGAVSVSADTFSMSGGTLVTSEDLTFTTLNWSAGRIGGTGKLTTTGTSTLNGYSKYLDDKTWDNSGTINLTGGNLYLNDSAAAGIPTLNNLAAGVINQESTSGDPIGGNNTTGTQRLFNNAGTLNWKVARYNDSYSDIQNVEFNNSGTVNVYANLRLVNAPGTDTGTYNIAAGQWLEQFSSVRTFASGSALNGDGQFRLYWYPEVAFATGSSVANTLDMYMYGGTLNSEIDLGFSNVLIDNGNFTAPSLDAENLTINNGSISAAVAVSSGLLTMNGGTVNALADLTLDQLEMSGNAVLASTGAVTVNSIFNVTGNNYLRGISSFTTKGTTTIDDQHSWGRTLRLDEGTHWTNEGELTIGNNDNIYLYGYAYINGANDYTIANSLTNTSTGTINLTGSNNSPIYSYYGTQTVNNAGVINKSSTDDQRLGQNDLIFNNSGTLNADAGRLFVRANGVDTGAYAIDTGAAVYFESGTRTLDTTSSISGSGVFGVNGATVSITPDVDFNALSADVVVSNYGQVNFNGATTLGNLTLTGNAILAGSGAVTVNGDFNVTGNGYLRGISSFTTKGTTTIDDQSSAGRTLQIDQGTHWTNEGELTIAGNDTIYLYGYAYLNGASDYTIANSLTNAASGTINLNGSNAYPVNSYHGTQSLFNEGVINKSSSSDQHLGQYNLVFNNSGTLNAEAGRLFVRADGVDTGAYAIDAGSAVYFESGTRTLDTTSSISGSGVFGVNGATVSITPDVDFDALSADVVVSSGRVNFNGTSSLGNLTLSGGAVLAGSGAVTVNGDFNVNGDGYLRGISSFTTKGTTTIDDQSNWTRTLYLDYGTHWSNEGTLTVAGNDRIYLYGYANINDVGTYDVTNTLTNTASGTINLDTDYYLPIYTYYGSQVVNNAGVINKNSSATQTLGHAALSFNHTGDLNVATGTLNIEGTGNYNGDINLAAGTTLRNSGHQHTYGPGGNINGSATFSVTENVDVTFEPGSTLGADMNLDLSYGTVTFNQDAPVNLDTVNLAAYGHLTGNADIVVETLNWRGISTISGNGKLITAGTSTLDGGNKYLTQKTWDNLGTINLDSGVLYLTNDRAVSGSPTLNNLAGGTVNVNANTSNPIQGWGNFGGEVLNNYGTVNWNTVYIDPWDRQYTAGVQYVDFNNHGSVNANESIRLSNSVSTHSGTFNAPDGKSVIFSRGTHNFDDGSMLLGAGSYIKDNTSLNLVGTSTGLINPAGNNLDLNYFGFGGSGVLTNQGTVTGGQGISSITLDNQSIAHLGNITLAGLRNSGTLNILEENGSAGTVAVLGDELLLQEGIINLGTGGTLEKQNGTFIWEGGSIISSGQGGNVTLTSADIQFAGNGERVLDAPGVDFTFNDLVLPSGSLILRQGNLTFNLTNNEATIIPDESLLQLDGGNLVNNGPLDIYGTFDMLSGDYYAGGNLNIRDGALNIASGFGSWSGDGIVTSSGNSTLSGSNDPNNPSVINSAYDVSGTLTLNGYVEFGDSFANSGTIFQSGNTTFNGAVDNTGTFNLSGTSIFNSLASNAGSMNFLGGTSTFAAGFNQVGGDATLSGGDIIGDVILTDGILEVRANRNVQGNVTMNGGMLKGNGGNISGNLLVNGGTLAPGASPGTLAVGSLTLTAGSQTQLEVGGLTAGSGYDVINVNGVASLDGQLNVEHFNGFVPGQPATLAGIINSQNLVGNFAAISLPEGFSYSVLYGSNVVNRVDLAFAGGAVPIAPVDPVPDPLVDDPVVDEPIITALNTPLAEPQQSLQTPGEIVPLVANVTEELVASLSDEQTIEALMNLPATAAGSDSVASDTPLLPTGPFTENIMLASLEDTYPPAVSDNELSITTTANNLPVGLQAEPLPQIIDQLTTSNSISVEQQSGFFSTLSEDRVISEFAASGYEELAAFLSRTAAGARTDASQLLAILEKMKQSPEKQGSYLAVYNRMREVAMKKILAKAIEKLEQDPEAADIFDDGKQGGPIEVILANDNIQTETGFALIEGQVKSESKILYLGIDGQWVFVDPDGNFSAEVPVKEGSSIVQLEVKDIGGVGARLNVKVNSSRAGDPLALAEGRRIALFIGVDDYSNGIPDLDTPLNDARVAAQRLAEKQGFETHQLHNPTKQQIIDALLKLSRELKQEDSLVVYYAGHGYQLEKSGRGYWLPADADVEGPEEWLSNRDVARIFHRTPAKQILLVSDSCYSGAFTRAEQFDIADDDVRRLRAVMALSSGGEQPVWDGGADGHSIFAAKFMETLDTDDLYGMPFYHEVRDKVVEVAPQIPGYGAMIVPGRDNGSDFVLKNL